MANIIGQRLAIPQIADPGGVRAQLMQTPANAPPVEGSLGGLFQAAAGGFMNTAHRDLQNAETQRALSEKAKIDQGVQGLAALSDLASRGVDLSSNPALAAAILSGRGSTDVAGFRRSQVLDDPNNPVGGDLATRAARGAGEAYGSTVAGTNQAEANRVTIANMTADRQAAAQIRGAQIAAAAEVQKAGMTPVTGVDANGNPAFASQATFGSTPGFHPAQSKDQVEALLLSEALKGTGGAPSAPTFTNAPPTAPSGTLDLSAAPAPSAPAGGPQSAADRLSSLPPILLKAIGLEQAPTTFINPTTNQVAMSLDGGRTGKTSDGQPVNLGGGGWVQGGPETGVQEARNAIAKQQAGAPSPFNKLDATTGAMADATRAAVGAGPAIGREISGAVGSAATLIGGQAPSLAPQMVGGEQKLDLMAQLAKRVMANSEQKGIKEQNIIGEMLPGTGLLRSPADEVQKLKNLSHFLSVEDQQIRQVIATTTDPKILAKEQARLNDVNSLWGMITEGAKPYAAPAAASGAPPATVAAPAAPAAGGAPAPADALAQAKAAIAAGKDRNAVVKRLQGWGIDPTGL